jgi:hypothetical protein
MNPSVDADVPDNTTLITSAAAHLTITVIELDVLDPLPNSVAKVLILDAS